MSRQRVRGDEDQGDGLVRLGDPRVTWWEPDYTQIMTSTDWYGTEGFGPVYGNFWGARICRVFPHDWYDLGEREHASVPLSWRRHVYRCQRCGSQVHVIPLLITSHSFRRGRV